jgi:hypothetical protein
MCASCRKFGEQMETKSTPCPLAVQLVEVPVEALRLGEEIALREVRVHDADIVVRVQGDHQRVARLLDGLEVPGGDEAGCTDQGKGCACTQGKLHECNIKGVIGFIWRSAQFPETPVWDSRAQCTTP